MKGGIFGTTVMVLSLFVFTAALPQQAHAWGSGFGKGPVAQLIQKLELSDQQLTQIADILKASREQVRAQGQIAGTELSALGDAMHQDEPSEEGIRQAYKNAADAVEELVVMRAKIMAQVREVLTEEQLDILARSREETKEKIEFGVALLRFAVDTWIDKHASN